MKKREPCTVGRNLDRIMRERDIRPSELEERSGVSRIAIWHLRSGSVVKPKLATVEALARGLGVDAAQLVEEPHGSTELEPLIGLLLADASAMQLLGGAPTAEELAWLRSLGRAKFGGVPPRSAIGLALLLQYHRAESPAPPGRKR